jgi:serine/threonine protein kinase
MIGSTIVGHRIEARLGEGGMGVVYRARHEQLGKLRALKLLPPHLAQDRQFRERFEREWRLAAAIEHPSIVEILDAGEAEGRLYIVMRLIDGADLATVVAAQGALEPVRVTHILEQIGDALDAAHAAGLVHRDVSPRNILVAASDRAYLADFGVARATAATGLTRTGYFVGNLDYASPEQIEGKAIDGRADIYALGGVLYTSLTGRTPFERETEVQVMYAHLNEAPPAPSAVREDLPPALDDVVAKAMAKTPDTRFQSCAEFVEALRTAVTPAGSVTSLPASALGNGAPGKATLLPDGLLTPGSVLGEYRIEALIGRGGMGIVYLAERPRLGSKVALKLLSAELAADERFRDRFVRESQMASALDHPNIIPVYDAAEADGRAFIAMRYVDGPSLKALLEETGSLDLERALNLLAQVGSALDAAHESNLIHRDVKPANILIAKGGASSFGEHVYLTDFGVSKRVGSHSGLTATGQFVGTLSYAAPEQIEGKSVDGRADLYAAACVLYEMLAGSPPFKRDNDVALLWAHVTEPPPRLSEVRSDLPPDLDAAIARGMAKSPDDRQPSCAQLIAEVRAACQTRTAAWSSALAATVVVEESATAVDPRSSPPTVAPAVVPPTEPTPVAPIVTSAATVAQTSAETPATVVEQGPTTADTPIANREPAVDTTPAAQPPRDVPPPTVPAAGLERKRRPSRKVVAAALLLIVLIGAAAAIAIAMSSSSGSKTSSGAPPAPATPPVSPPVGKLAVASFHVGRAVAGGSLAALLTVRQSGFARSAAAKVLCRGAIGDRPIAATRSVSGRVGTCRWQVPVEAAGRTLAGTVAIRRGHVSVSRGFSLRVNPSPGKVVLTKAPVIASGPKAGRVFVVDFPLRLESLGQRRSLPTATTTATCRAHVPGRAFTRGTTTLSGSGVTCAWTVPSNASGRRLLLLLHVVSEGRAASFRFPASVPRSVAPSPPPAPPAPPASPPPSPTPTPAPPAPPPPASTPLPTPVPQ